MRNPLLLTRVSLAAIIIIGLSGTAHAQPAVPAPATPEVEDCAALPTQPERDSCVQNQAVPVAGEPVAGGDDDAIVVTGSRIRRDSFNTGENVTVITREESTQAGFNSTTEALQSNAVTNGSAQINNAFGGFVTDGGPGANTISLRGLGATRTLVLLNGRRISPAGSRGSVGSADLNVLPTSIVDRIEILKAGASSIYGSDAVAGVINVLTRKKVSGVAIEMQHNVNEIGAGNSRRYSIVGGYSNDRFQISGTVEYLKRSSVLLNDVDFTECQQDLRRTAADRTLGSGDFIDPVTGESKCYPITGTGVNGVTINTLGTSFRSGVTLAPGFPAGPAGTTVFCNRARPVPSLTTGTMPGFECVGGVYFNPVTGRQFSTSLGIRDTFDPEMLEATLISPASTLTGFVQSSYQTDLLGDAEVYAELLATRRKSSQIGYRQLSLDYIKGSPLIPANLQAFTFSGPQETSGGQSVGVRAFIGFGNLDASQEIEFVRANAGVRGAFFLPNWRYDAFVGKSWSDATYRNESFLTSRIAQSTDVVAGPGGTFLCRNAAGGCVAAPFLTPAVIGGELPDAFRDYIVAEVVGTTKFRETTFAFGVDGPLFRLPGGDLQIALGAEYRKATIDDTPPEDSQIGNLYNLTSATPTRGSDSVWEVFGEVELPILRNVPLAYDLTVNASARYTEYKSYGGDKTYKIGGQYSPVKWFSLRGNYGTSYRAPALFEQFLGATSGFLSQQNDPCNAFDAAGVNPVRAANCASEGLASGFQATSGIRVLTAGGAESGLVAETSKSWSVGGVVQPRLGKFGDISFAVDYFRVQVDNGVSRAGAGNILSLCYDDPEFQAGGGFCNLVSRAPVSNQLTVNNNYVNLSTDIVKGLDFNARYSIPVGPGRFRVSAAVTKFIDQQSRLFADDPLDDVNGTINNPKWTGSFDTAYTTRRWNFRYGVEWIDATDSYAYFGLDKATTPFYLETPDYFLHNASVQWKTDAFGITLGVRNLFDKQAPRISSGVYSRVGNSPVYSGYDYVGRSFFINVSAALDKVGSGLGL